MARRRFFVPQVRLGEAELSGKDAEHLVRVLRAEVGQIYEISDNRALYLARIKVARKSSIVFEIMEDLPAPTDSVRVTLAVALFKFDRFEWLVEKATELGIHEIIPFNAIRSERGLLQAAVKRRARWERVALEASQQSRRARLPVMAEGLSFNAALERVSAVNLFLDEDPSAPPMLHNLPPGAALTGVALMIGPEGGWTDSERADAVEKHWLPSSLGQTVLRAETAGIAALSVLQAWASANRFAT